MMINFMNILFTGVLAFGTLLGGPETQATAVEPATQAGAEAVEDRVESVAPAAPAPVATPVRSSGGYVVTVTAYTSEPRQTDSTPCISADGSDICARYAQGEKICATNDHPMHSTLYVEGYGECTVRDRMNTRYTGTGRVDIYLGYDTPAAFQWGVRRVNIARL